MTRKFICKTCFKGFDRKGDLTRHVHLHTGYKPHKCDDCGKSFSQFSGLKTHRNVHTKVKPFACGMHGCRAAFGDPSSRARHCKETHRTLGAYRCPISHCKSSIKRRSAFTLHLQKKHNIDPTTVDIEALAPALLPRQAPGRPKPIHQQHAAPDSRQDNKGPSVTFINGLAHAYNPSETTPNYYAIPQFQDDLSDFYANNAWFSSQTMNLPTFPTEGLYTIGSPASPPDLTYSLSPSPAPPGFNDFLHTPKKGAALPSLGSSPSLSSLSHSPLLYFSEPTTYAGHNQKQPIFDFESSIFGLTEGIRP